MSGLGDPIGFDGVLPTVTDQEAFGILISLLPPGELYDLGNPDSDVYKFFSALAQSWNLYGFNIVDRLRVEVNPFTCIEKVEDWVTALGIGGDIGSPNHTLAQRQAAIVSKLREHGATTKHNVRAIIGPLLGYTDPNALVIVETDRDTLSSAHAHFDLPGTVIVSGDTLVIPVLFDEDGGFVSAMGAQVSARMTSTGPMNEFIIQLKDTTGTLRAQWSMLNLLGSGNTQVFYSKAPAGVALAGTWTLSFINNSAFNGTLNSWSLFMEGIDQNQATGGAIFEWGVYADPALVNSPDYAAARRAIQRIQPAHSIGYLLYGTSGAYPDTDTGVHSAIPDSCLPF